MAGNSAASRKVYILVRIYLRYFHVYMIGRSDFVGVDNTLVELGLEGSSRAE